MFTRHNRGTWRRSCLWFGHAAGVGASKASIASNFDTLNIIYFCICKFAFIFWFCLVHAILTLNSHSFCAMQTPLRQLKQANSSCAKTVHKTPSNIIARLIFDFNQWNEYFCFFEVWSESCVRSKRAVRKAAVLHITQII